MAGQLLRRLDVAVIGAGAAGLATARELTRSGHTVTIFEQAPPEDGVGGVWVYTDETEEEVEQAGHPPSSVHSSMYAGLRTNLPRHLMSFSDFPFDEVRGVEAPDARTYPGHAEVRAYLAAFSAAHGLDRLVRHGAAVTACEPVEEGDEAVAGRPPLPWPRWRVRTGSAPGETAASTIFDALAVCNGHFALPRHPPLNIDPAWDGVVLHSHNYRSPSVGRLGAALAAAGGHGVVAILGSGPSGEDLARELSPHAGSVLLCASSWEGGRRVPSGPRGNVRAAPWITGVGPNGVPVFGEGGGDAPHPPPRLTALILATGYRYSFPFLSPDVVSVVDNEVLGLADHLWIPEFAPGLALVGLPFKVVPFPLMEAQARRVGAALSGVAPVAPAELEARAKAQAASRSAAGIPRRHAHCLSGARQWAYMEGLVAESAVDGSAPPPSSFMPPWRAALYDAASAARKADPDGYRDDQGSGVVAGPAAEAARAWVMEVAKEGER